MGQSPEDLFKKATALIQAGAGPQAIDLFRKPIEAGPANPVLFFYGGVSATMTGDKELAIAWLEKAADGLPDQAEVLNTCGFALFQAGRYEAAIGVLEKALLTDPKHAMAWLNMGMSCLGLAEHQKAREALLKSIVWTRTIPSLMPALPKPIYPWVWWMNSGHPWRKRCRSIPRLPSPGGWLISLILVLREGCKGPRPGMFSCRRPSVSSRDCPLSWTFLSSLSQRLDHLVLNFSFMKIQP